MALRYNVAYTPEGDFALPVKCLISLHRAIPTGGLLRLGTLDEKRISFRVEGKHYREVLEGTCERDQTPRLKDESLERFTKALPRTRYETKASTPLAFNPNT
jgi:hypothetical protein